MHETLSRPYQTIPSKRWTSPENRDHNETVFRTPLGEYGHEFDDSQYACLLALDTIGEGVVKEMNQSFSKEGGGFRTIYNANFDNPGGTFSGGYMVFGARTRELAEQYQAAFIHQVNETLAGVEAGFRLDEPEPFF